MAQAAFPEPGSLPLALIQQSIDASGAIVTVDSDSDVESHSFRADNYHVMLACHNFHLLRLLSSYKLDSLDTYSTRIAHH